MATTTYGSYTPNRVNHKTEKHTGRVPGGKNKKPGTRSAKVSSGKRKST